jgi:hypothetical protein
MHILFEKEPQRMHLVEGLLPEVEPPVLVD